MRKKILLWAAVLVGVFSVWCCASAAGVTNPHRSHVEEMIRWRKQKTTTFNNLKKFMSGAPTVTVNCDRTPTLSAPGKFTVTLNNDDGGTNWEFQYGVTDTVRDPNGFIYCPDVRTKNRVFEGLEFYTAGKYALYVFLYKSGEEQPTDVAYLPFTVAEDNAHITLEAKIAQIVADCQGEDDWHTALNLHDWLTQNMYYDYSFSYYGADAIFRGKGVCDSYSKAYKMLCSTAGISGDRITSVAMNHAWNAIKLDDQWYQVDVTWDDPGEAQQALSGSEGYDYFCLNDEIMFLDHESPDESSFNPGCDSLDANYYVKTGKWVDFTVYTYSGATVQEFFQNQIGAGQTAAVLSTNSEGGWIWYRVENGGIGLSKAQYIICVYALNRAEWALGDDPIQVEVTYNASDHVVRAVFRGWSIEETGTLELPGDLETIQAEAFAGTEATTVRLPNRCQSILDKAFQNSGVRTVIVPDSVTTIADDAFDGCGMVLFKTENEYAISYAQTHNILVLDP